MAILTPNAFRSRTSRALAEAAVAGDKRAAEELARESWPAAYRVAYLTLGDRRAAEDVAQETLIAALRAIGTFDLEREFGPWIERIAANRAIDFLRHRSRRPETLVEDPAPLAIDSEEIANQIAVTALPDEILAVLGTLDSDQRVAVVLRHLLDYEPAEIAEIVGATPGAIRSRIHRALMALRKSLIENEGGHRHEQAG